MQRALLKAGGWCLYRHLQNPEGFVSDQHGKYQWSLYKYIIFT